MGKNEAGRPPARKWQWRNRKIRARSIFPNRVSDLDGSGKTDHYGRARTASAGNGEEGELL